MTKVEFKYGQINTPKEECVVCISKHSYMGCTMCEYLAALRQAARVHEEEYIARIQKQLEEDEEE